MNTIFAQAELTPNHVLAGDSVEFVLRLVVGDGYTPNPSRIIFDFPGQLGTSRPSLWHREDNGFIRVYVSQPHVTYVHRIWDMEYGEFIDVAKGAGRGAARRLLVLDLSAGLRLGDVIELHWGDAGDGYGVGTKVPTFIPYPDFAPAIHVRYFDNQNKGLPDWGHSFQGFDRPVPDSEIAMTFTVEPRELDHLRVIRQVDRAAIIPQDRFGNVASTQAPSAIAYTDEPGRSNRYGVLEFKQSHVQVRSKGLHLKETPPMDDVVDGFDLYWGDVHTHSAFSRDCAERERMSMLPADLMRFARDRARLDFFAVTDHQRPGDDARYQIGRSNWERTLDAVQAYDCPARFVVLPGFEWKCPRGDTVFLCDWLPSYSEFANAEWNSVRDVWKAWTGRDYISIPHLHNAGELALGEWWENQDASKEPVLEIFSCHGSYERANVVENQLTLAQSTRSDRYGAFFLGRGFRYGFVCNSDGHKGHIGLNGLTAVFARTLDHSAILDAYRQRRVYGTTNARIRLVFQANGQLMGSIAKNTVRKHFHVAVRGEDRLKRIDVFRNGTCHQRFYPDGITLECEFDVEDETPSNWYVRVTQVDNHQAFSSPIWFEP